MGIFLLEHHKEWLLNYYFPIFMDKPRIYFRSLSICAMEYDAQIRAEKKKKDFHFSKIAFDLEVVSAVMAF